MISERRSVKLRIRGGQVTLANRDVPTGRYGYIRIIEIYNVPEDVTDKDVCRIYSHLVDIGDRIERDFKDLMGENRVLA